LGYYFSSKGRPRHAHQTPVPLSALDGLADDKLTGFALRLVLTQHSPTPREAEIDLLAEAEAAFATPKPKKTASKKVKKPTPIKASKSKKATVSNEAAA